MSERSAIHESQAVLCLTREEKRRHLEREEILPFIHSCLRHFFPLVFSFVKCRQQPVDSFLE